MQTMGIKAVLSVQTQLSGISSHKGAYAIWHDPEKTSLTIEKFKLELGKKTNTTLPPPRPPHDHRKSGTLSHLCLLKGTSHIGSSLRVIRTQDLFNVMTVRNSAGLTR